MSRLVFRALVCGLFLSVATPASAQWYGVVYFGANKTQPADITVKGDGYDQTFQKVKFGRAATAAGPSRSARSHGP